MAELGEEALSIAIRSAEESFKGEIELLVQLEEGSVTARVTAAIGIALAVYGGIANYKSFKESVAEIASDAKAFNEYVKTTFLAKAQVREKSIYRVERRSKTPGRILKALKRYEWLEEHKKELSRSDQDRVRAVIERQLQLALEDLSKEDQEQLLKAMREIPSEGDDRPESPRVAIRGRHDQMELAIDKLEAGGEPIGEYVARARVKRGAPAVILTRQYPQSASRKRRLQ
ncbi:MAG: hypothetical protein QM651_03305 [Rhodoblastus sp.]